ncbi:sensor histidine kinase [Ekhidna sp.]|uniref:sensor histidine kinase n=1 Tax=Ekhidna sp. TaxID=2608089 RepID=UPI003B5CC57E
MTKRSYRYILILIVVTAVVLIGAQVYFTIQNYEMNKQRFIQDVQQSLDASIEGYFADRAKSNIYILTQTDSDTIVGGRRALGFASRFDNIDRLFSDSIELSASSFTHVWSDSSSGSDSARIDSILKANNSNQIKRLQLTNDTGSVRIKEFRNLTQKVMISISEELLNIGELYGKVKEELANKNLDIAFALNQKVQGRKTTIGKMETQNYLSATSTSAYLGSEHSIGIDFENATLIILRNGISELILSVLLIGLVVGTLIHLYRTINAQKQLAAIKDDLISNITHEFKTPIATIFSALEGVTSFNETNDPEKTKRYLALSNDQLRKLNDMVEKMLETATIDQGKLSLNKEETEVVKWTKEMVDRFRMVEKEKQISFETELTVHEGIIDRFHLENALCNLVDNAIKYGGDHVTVRLKQEEGSCIWEVEDNGGNIPKAQRDKVFDKLYRIPSGNKHDVKGFGIGLYYARNIAELHGGQLTLGVANNQTLFKLQV